MTAMADRGQAAAGSHRPPRRVQLRRTKGWHKPAGVVTVSRPSRWGNPHRVVPGVAGSWSIEAGTSRTVGFPDKASAVVEAVERFRSDIEDLRSGVRIEGYPTFSELLDALAGHDLACWCPPGTPCHADVLLEVVNDPRDMP